MGHKMTAEQYKKQVLSNPGTRFIVEDLITVLEDRDIVDVLNDLEIINKYFTLKYNEALDNLTHNNNA